MFVSSKPWILRVSLEALAAPAAARGVGRCSTAGAAVAAHAPLLPTQRATSVFTRKTHQKWTEESKRTNRAPAALGGLNFNRAVTSQCRAGHSGYRAFCTGYRATDICYSGTGSGRSYGTTARGSWRSYGTTATGSWRSYSTTARGSEGHDATNAIIAATHLDDKRAVEMEWSSGEKSEYPWLWLRDNCQCPQCFHPVSLSRTFSLKDLDLNIRPHDTQVSREQLRVRWSDGHVSQHGALWLQERAFQEAARASRDLVHKLPRAFWEASLPSVMWSDLLNDDKALLSWMVLLETYGLVLVKEAPKHPNSVKLLADRVAFVKRTHYGKAFAVIAKPNPSNVAYSNSTLALHLDLPYYFYKPGVQLIHCVQQYEGEGGDSQVSDALQIAEHMRHNNPHLFHLLSSTPVDWVDQATEDGRDYHKTLKIPIICLEDDRKSIWRINFSQPQRDSYFTACPPEVVSKWYEALKTFHDLLYDPRFCRTFKMESGSLMTLDNLRVTHGRTGYPSSSNVRRHIEGCYIDWDEMRSRRRVLQQRYNNRH